MTKVCFLWIYHAALTPWEILGLLSLCSCSEILFLVFVFKYPIFVGLFYLLMFLFVVLWGFLFVFFTCFLLVWCLVWGFFCCCLLVLVLFFFFGFFFLLCFVTEGLFLSCCVPTKYKEKTQILMRPPSLLQLIWPTHWDKRFASSLLKMFGFWVSFSLDSNLNHPIMC